jgi:hypothetical protein
MTDVPIDDDQELASWRQAFAAPSQQTNPSACLAPETIWDAVHGDLPADAVRESVEHVATCASCAEEWRLARALQEQEAAAPAATAAPAPLRFAPRRRMHRWRSWGLAAAAALVIAGVGVQQLRTPVYRGEEVAVHSQVAEDKALPRDRFLLKWSVPAPAGATYNLKVSTEDLRNVAAVNGLKVPQYQVPASALTGLPAGAKLLWNIDVDLPAGSHLVSPTFVTAVQ